MIDEHTTPTVSDTHYVVGLEALDATQVALAGGKAAQLGALARIDGVRVPPGFCVTTDAFRRAAGPTVPDDVADAIADALARLGDDTRAYAVRSSTTTEDAPTSSFAGLHDSYLDVVGASEVVRHVGLVWASLTSERAVAYRQDDQAAEMAVVVQQMVVPRASGVMFTADPMTGDRRIVSIEAAPGLGEALVSGQVDPDGFTVRDGRVASRTGAGEPALSDAEVVDLAQLGRRVEARFGRPQDIEWCLDEDGFALVQSRPITTLFPIPVADDDAHRVYLSVGHQQMMTDPMKPLGLSIKQLTALPRMYEAGGRLFVDVAQRLASPATREALLDMVGTSDPLTGDALRSLIDRGDFDGADVTPPEPLMRATTPEPIEADPAVVEELVARTDASIAELRRTMPAMSGVALFAAIREDIQELRRLLFEPGTHQVLTAGMDASRWLNERLEQWLGVKNAADTLTLSVEGNVTSEMGLALLDVADVIRPYPEVVALLQHIDDGDDGFLDALPGLTGGREVAAAIGDYLDRYGMRCVGEIDITRPRWSERPSSLVPLLVANVRNFEPGLAARRFEEGRREAQAMERSVLERLRALPDGERKAAEAKRMIDRVRTFSGYREYPKYGMICRYFVYKRSLMAEAERLVADGVLRTGEDAFYLSLDELEDVARTGEADHRLIARRRREFASYASLTPPRVLTSDGECVAGSYRREDMPDGALVGLAVSSGTVEGRARVVVELADARCDPGDILVTRFTDPSWSALFVAVAGLVTEVGGLMTHGAVIAREYGLPAVVGVDDATRAIRDGQRIRVHGTDGFVELLD